MKYLFDANVFIQAKNWHYAFDICPGFWDWMDHVTKADVGSVVPVCDELRKGRDELAQWANARRTEPWFLTVTDASTQKAMTTIATHVASSGYTPQAQAKFLSGADPWLIAKAQTIGARVVTHEQPAPSARSRVPIPNVCDALGVLWEPPYDTLRAMAASFTFKAP
jgi:Domain of unknown function (DUF4411)